MHWSYHSNPTWSYKKHYRMPGNKTKSEPTDGVATMTLHTDEWKGDRNANYARMYHQSGRVGIETVALPDSCSLHQRNVLWKKISAINLYRMLIRQPATGGYAGIDTQHGEWFILHLRRFTTLYRNKKTVTFHQELQHPCTGLYVFLSWINTWNIHLVDSQFMQLCFF